MSTARADAFNAVSAHCEPAADSGSSRTIRSPSTWYRLAYQITIRWTTEGLSIYHPGAELAVAAIDLASLSSRY